ncbi:hypothetical protein JTE90_021271 [Oedothorax gibbosus]|uniref:Uncharacterized protein n=1 Tax=Oedothorax gibbosus TaxID=931172 RepID=A0AAV6TLG7_9ARAC|nr:hypothetical protein JTE90_021271 [Oedothorax gibbosus]
MKLTSCHLFVKLCKKKFRDTWPHPLTNRGTAVASIESLVREVERSLAPIAKQPMPNAFSPPRRPAYSTVTRRTDPVTVGAPGKTNVWRTEDNRPVCFHCGRPTSKNGIAQNGSRYSSRTGTVEPFKILPIVITAVYNRSSPSTLK